MCVLFFCCCLFHYVHTFSLYWVFRAASKGNRMSKKKRARAGEIWLWQMFKLWELKIVNKQWEKKGEKFLKHTRMPEHLEFFLFYLLSLTASKHQRTKLQNRILPYLFAHSFGPFISNPFTLSNSLFLSFSFNCAALISLFAVLFGDARKKKNSLLKLFIFFDFD